MIGIVFDFGGKTVEVRIDKPQVFFRTSQFMSFGDIDGIKLDKRGVIKEFPYLKDDKEWEKKAREKFKQKIKKMETEKEIADYIIKDLTKFGYKPIFMQIKGSRPIKL